MVGTSAFLYGCEEDAYVCRAFTQQEASDGFRPSELGFLTLLMSSCTTWLPGQETVWTHREQQDLRSGWKERAGDSLCLLPQSYQMQPPFGLVPHLGAPGLSWFSFLWSGSTLEVNCSAQEDYSE